MSPDRKRTELRPLMSLRHSLKRRFGRSKVSLRLEESYPDILDPAFHAAMELCREATMTSIDRLYALFAATRYVIEARVPGAFVECGVWKGGSVMMMAATLKSLGVTDRDIHLFDTFTAMPEPDDKKSTIPAPRCARWQRQSRIG